MVLKADGIYIYIFEVFLLGRISYIPVAFMAIIIWLLPVAFVGLFVFLLSGFLSV